MKTFDKPSDIAISKYSGNRRPGSSSPSPSPATLLAWRTALLGTVAAGALMLGHDRAALAGPDSCNLLVPAIATCSGNQSNGVLGSPAGGGDFDPDPGDDNKTILNVTNLSANITPAVDVPGIGFGSDGNVFINSDTTNGPGGPFEIITTGLGVGVIGASNLNDVTIIHTGDITSEDDGIRGTAPVGNVEVTATSDIDAGVNGIIVLSTTGTGSVTVSSTGDITANESGIRAVGYDEQNVLVASTGNVSGGNSGGNFGIIAVSALGTAEVVSVGTVSGDYGIGAGSLNSVQITSTGDIFGTTVGIYASSVYFTADVTSTGDITSVGDGIRIIGGGGVQVTSLGDISAEAGNGIDAFSGAGAIGISSTGEISAGLDGITALSVSGAADISSTGDITAGVYGIQIAAAQDVQATSQGDISAEAADGINALSTAGTVGISSTGDIDAGLSGVAVVAAEAIFIASNGDITAGASGLGAISDNSSIVITSTGNIEAEEFGITAIGPTAVEITSQGNISSATSIGIFASSTIVNVFSTGNITAANDGIEAIGVGEVQVTSEGNITSDAADGIAAFSGAGNATVSSRGGITASLTGLYARSLQTTRVTSVGDIDAGDFGIDARSDNADVDVSSTGDIRAGQAGIGVDAGGSASVVSVGNITGAATGISGTASDAFEITISGGTVDGSFTAVGGQSVNAGVTINNLAGGTIDGGDFAVFTESATGTTVNNTGTVTGNVVTNNGGGNNLFDNLDGGLFNAGTTVDLGAGGVLRNAGTLSPAGVDTVATTAVTGNVTQTGSGVFEVDVDPVAGTADRVDVTETADLAGSVRVQVQSAVSGEQSNIILSAAGGTTDNGLGLLASPALQASLDFPNANDVVLTTEVNFSPLGLGLNENQTNLAGNLNEIFNGGVGGLAPVLDALLNGIVTVPDYIAALDQLIPEVYLNTETAALFAAERFNEKLLSCPQAGPGYTAISQGQCMWLRYDGRWMDRDGTFENIGFDEDARGISGGAQVAVAPRWTLGFAGAYENADLETDVGEEADSSRYMLGGVIKYQSGPTLLALVGSVGYGDTEVLRPFDFGGFNATARSSYDVDHMGATFHAAYLMDRGSWYAKPFVDVNVTRIDREAAQETGGGAANLNVSGSDETYFSVTPALELGTTIDRGNGGMVRPYIRAGVTFYSDTDQSLLARFAAAPAGVGAFQTNSEFDDVYADLEAGLTLFRGQSATVSAGYEGRFSDDVESHGIFIKGSRTF